MNREIKFRIWCKGTSTNANFNKPRWIQPTDFILLKYYRCFQDVIESDDFIVQQYTGLKDLNGNEIYEGDILKYSDLYYEVIWADYQWVATCPYYNRYHWPKFESFGREARASTVSGNIMQNPELLKTNE